jgi:NAD(P)-dependent dehydrogenase (short-subunit alcohol dehydrogenase family)
VKSEPITLVVGAANVIGRAVVADLTARRDQIVLADADGESLHEVATSAGLTDVNSKAYVVDVCDRHDIEAMCADIIDRLHHITYVFLDSEAARPGSVSEIALEDWEAALERRLTAAFHLCQVVIPYMIQRKHGAIVLNCSDVALSGSAGDVGGVASHAALYSFAKALALEFAAEGIRINSIGPGTIETLPGNIGGSDESEFGGRTKATPMRRLGRPEEVAAVAQFLLSERASYLTGQLIQVNGGRNGS